MLKNMIGLKKYRVPHTGNVETMVSLSFVDDKKKHKML